MLVESLPSSDTNCIFKCHNWSSSSFWIFFCPLFQTHPYSFSIQNLVPLWRLFESPSSRLFFSVFQLLIFSYKLHCDYVCIAPSSPICGDIVGMRVSHLTLHSDCYIMKTFLLIDIITLPHNLTNLWESPWDSAHMISYFYYLIAFWLIFF